MKDYGALASHGMTLAQRVAARYKLARQVRVLVDVPATLEARRKWPAYGTSVVGTFDEGLALYRVFDETELKHIVSSGRITGGSYSVAPERSHGASWGHNITQVINMGNQLRGGRLGDRIYLAKIDGFDQKFLHLDPNIDFDQDGPTEQPARMNPDKCNPGLGCSIFVDTADVEDFYKVHPNGQVSRMTAAELSEEDKLPIKIKEVPDPPGTQTVEGQKVVIRSKGSKWFAYLLEDGRLGRAIGTNATTEEDAVTLAGMAIRMRPSRPIQMDQSILDQRRRHDKMFEPDEDPEKVRGGFGLKPRDKVFVLKGSRRLKILSRETLVVADVYQRKGERPVIVKLLVRGKPVALHAIHPNRLKDTEVSLLDGFGGKILVQKKP